MIPPVAPLASTAPEVGAVLWPWPEGFVMRVDGLRGIDHRAIRLRWVGRTAVMDLRGFTVGYALHL